MSTSVILAKIFAMLQTGICGMLAILGGLGLLAMESRGAARTTAMLSTVAATILAVLACAFFFRQNWARLFLAGLHALLSLGWAVLAVLCVIAHAPIAAFFLLVPLGIAVAGAFTFVSVDVRAYCGEHVVVGRPGAERVGR